MKHRQVLYKQTHVDLQPEKQETMCFNLPLRMNCPGLFIDYKWKGTLFS